MRTSISLLPAINSLYDLNLTQTDIDDLSTKINSFVNEFKSNEKSPTLDYDNDLKLLTYIVRRGNALYYALPANAARSTNDQVEIKRYYDTDPKRIEKLNAMIADGERGFVVQVRGRYSDNKFIILSEVKQADLPKIATIQSFLSKAEFKKLFNDTYGTTYKNIDTFRDTLEKELWDNYELMTNSNRDYDVKFMRKVLNLLVPKAQHTQTEKLSEINRKVQDSPRNTIRVITDVYEQNNVRICLTLGPGYYDENNVGVIAIHSDHASFDYADVDRFYITDSDRYDGEKSTAEKPFGKALFIDQDPAIPKDHVLKHMSLIINDEDTRLLTEDDIKLIVKRLAQKEARENAEKKQREALEKKVEQKIKVLEDPKGFIKLNNVLFYNNHIEYAGQTLSFQNRPNWVYSLVRRFTYSWNLNDINYDHVFDAFIELASSSLADTQGTIGTVNFNIELKSSTNVRGISSTRYYVNGCRINREEINPCLNRAICFENQEDYDYFLKSVSTCSLKIHRYLQTGIDIDVRDDFDGSNCVMKLPLERRKNLNYLVLNDQEYRIRDTHKVLGLQKKYHLLDVINILLTDTVVVGVEADDIKGLIEAAKKEYITAVEKSKQLLQETEDLFKIKLDTVELQDGKRRRGYVINGNMRQYFLEYTETEDDRAGVYSYPDGRYICIVDKSTSQVGMDKLVNRIYALHNDSLVASQINTLN